MLRSAFALPKTVPDEERGLVRRMARGKGRRRFCRATGKHMEVFSPAAFGAHRALQARAPRDT